MPQAQVSVGMPVYNGAKTIALAIDSILNQTFEDFELIISDNASTDGTYEILRAYAERDRRIRLIRQPTNIGANGNYSAVAREARGRWFKWASSNDWCAPTFLEKCAAVLGTRVDVVLVHPRSKIFTSSLADAREHNDSFEAQQERPSARFIHVIEHLKLNNAMNGLIRTAALESLPLLRPHYSSDMVLMGRLALIGKIVELPDRLFFRCMDPSTATIMRSQEESTRHRFPVPTARALFQSWRLQAAWVEAAASAAVPWGEKRRAIHAAIRMLYWRRNELVSDVREACQYITRKLT